MTSNLPALNEIDREILEPTALKVPWYMVCGDFHHCYGLARALARRLFDLSDAGLVRIREKTPGDDLPSPEALETDALANNCYNDFDSSPDARWEIMATDCGLPQLRKF